MTGATLGSVHHGGAQVKGGVGTVMTGSDHRKAVAIISTKHQRIAAELRDAIKRGELTGGQRLGSEAEIGATYGASRTTVRAALSALAHEGLISSEPGRGWFVRERQPMTYFASRAERADRPRSETDAYVDEVRAAGRVPSQEFSMSIEPAPSDIATRLAIAEGDLAVRRRCMRYIDGQPWSDQVSWYPIDVARESGIDVPHDIAEGTVRAMAKAGHVEIGYIDELSARMPTPDEARLLNLGPGDPILEYVRTSYTKTRPVRVTKTAFAGDRNRVVYELGSLDGAP